MSYPPVLANKKSYAGSDKTIIGDGNSIRGDRNLITGDKNNIIGNNNKIVGNWNDVVGDNNKMTGNSNFAKGENNLLIGEDNMSHARIASGGDSINVSVKHGIGLQTGGEGSTIVNHFGSSKKSRDRSPAPVRAKK